MCVRLPVRSQPPPLNSFLPRPGANPTTGLTGKLTELNTSRPTKPAMKYLIWTLIFLLCVLHQDYWQWNNSSLDFGFLPRALTYHVALSLVAAGVWLLAITCYWKVDLVEAPESRAKGSRHP